MSRNAVPDILVDWKIDAVRRIRDAQDALHQCLLHSTADDLEFVAIKLLESRQHAEAVTALSNEFNSFGDHMITSSPLVRK